MKEIVALIFDTKLTSDGTLHFLETGDVYQSDFFDYDRLHPAPMYSVVLQKLAILGHVHYERDIQSAPTNSTRHANVLEAVQAGIIKQGIVVVSSNERYHHDRVIRLRDYCKQNNLDDIIVVNAQSELYAYNKLAFKIANEASGTPRRNTIAHQI